MLSSWTTVALGAISAFTSISHAAPLELENRAAALKFNYGGTKVRGVNLGGWFVLEPWITPSIFDPLNGAAVDEYTLCQTLGKTECSNRLTTHWNTWITQADFNAIAKAGLNHVRIPIGYWSISPLPGDPYVQGAYDVLGKSLDWAQAAGLKVLIDLHGAPGSQNGFDNSGRRGDIDWLQGNTLQQTKDALNKIRVDHANHPAVAAIELINEPMGPKLNQNTITQFYYDGAGANQASPVASFFHDAFLGLGYWNSFGTGLTNIVLDTHHYEVFDTGVLAMDINAHVSTACGFGSQMASTNKITVSGEWTGAMTDCAKWLNGYGTGARYDNTFEGDGKVYGSCAPWKTGSITQLPVSDQQNTRRFIEAQLDAFEKAAGWIWWTWKTEGAPGWDMGDLIKAGVFPQPLSDRKYPGQCG